VVGRADLLCALSFLLSFYCYTVACTTGVVTWLSHLVLANLVLLFRRALSVSLDEYAAVCLFCAIQRARNYCLGQC
jgi:hypothetical protein